MFFSPSQLKSTGLLISLRHRIPAAKSGHTFEAILETQSRNLEDVPLNSPHGKEDSPGRKTVSNSGRLIQPVAEQ